MATQPYKNALGKRVPGVTTVIGANCGWNKDMLIGWANREGLAGRDVRDRSGNSVGAAADAAEVGTHVHSCVEEFIHGRPLPVMPAEFTPEMQVAALSSFGAFEEWFGGSSRQIVATEIFGVDEEYQTGFCADALLLSPKGLELGDWKTSKGTYADHVVQVATYLIFCERLLSAIFGTPIEIRGAHVIRFDKKTGMFSHKFWPRAALLQAWNAFTWLRALHQVRWDIEALTK